MIQANELRVGNKFYYWPIAEEMKIDTVVALRTKSKSFAQCLIKGEKSEWKQETQCHPIPLTPEILEKAGFKRDDGANCDLSLEVEEYHYIGIEKGEFFVGGYHDEPFYGYFIKDFKYLHQLQNLYFILSGKELEITL